MRYPNEPHILIGGVLVHSGAVWMLEHLRASGHVVALDDHGEVTVQPDDDLPEDTAYLLEAFEDDLAILLTAGGGPTIH